VSKYLASTNLPPSNIFNSSNRAYPDVSINGHNFVIVAGLSVIEQFVIPEDGLNGAILTVGGTSASSPTFAGMIALINDWLLSNNKPTLGYVI
jgi:tripeptidyl-peptidase-1